MTNETLELARALIRRRSVTPDDDGCQQLIIERLLPLGFVPEVMASGGVTNLFIRHGRAKPLVVLAGHNGRRGSLTGPLVVQGVQGHVAYPHRAKNPMHLAAPALAALTGTRPA